MSLLAFERIRKCINRNVCIKTAKLLDQQAGEVLVSASEFPKLYDRRIDREERKFLIQVVKTLLANRSSFAKLDERDIRKIQLFFTHVLDINAVGGLELFLQAYVFLFWREIEFTDSLVSPRGDLYWLSNSSVDPYIPTTNKFMPLIKKIQSTNLVDLVAVDEETGVLFLIEVKRGKVDDRCVGQVLRYFDAVCEIIYKENRSLDINYVRPVVVCAGANYEKWRAFPNLFRDLVDIYTCRKSVVTDELTISNTRRQLLSEYSNLMLS